MKYVGISFITVQKIYWMKPNCLSVIVIIESKSKRGFLIDSVAGQ